MKSSNVLSETKRTWTTSMTVKITVHLKGLSVECTCRTWLLRWSGLKHQHLQSIKQEDRPKSEFIQYSVYMWKYIERDHLCKKVNSAPKIQIKVTLTTQTYQFNLLLTVKKPWHSADTRRVSLRHPGAIAHGSSCGLSSWNAADKLGRSRAFHQSEKVGDGSDGTHPGRPFHMLHSHGFSALG